MRIDDDGDPNDGAERDFGNAAGVHKENAVVDAGFLDARPPRRQGAGRPRVADSLPETDASLATDTPSGRVWHRYTFDGYGEKADGSPWTFNTPGTEGRAWPLLGGERGEYEVANGRAGLPFLRTMANTANDGYMIPEQVWDEPEPAPAPYGYQPGKATGSASPLAWAMAQYVRLARAIAAGQPVETPAVVRDRYATGLPAPCPSSRSPRPRTARSPAAARSPCAARPTPRGSRSATATPRHRHAERRHLQRPVTLQRGRNQITVVAVGADGGTNMQQVTVVSFGTRVGGLADPAGDDNGPGTYVYPTNSAFARAGSTSPPSTSTPTATTRSSSPRSPARSSTPGAATRSPTSASTSTSAAAPARDRAALPGTNLDTAGGWDVAVVGDGRFDTAGVYAPGATAPAADGDMLAVPETHQIAVVVPRSALGGIDLRARATASPCSATARRARASATSGPSTTATTGTTPRTASAGSRSTASAAAPASGTTRPAMTPTPATPTRST